MARLFHILGHALALFFALFLRSCEAFEYKSSLLAVSGIGRGSGNGGTLYDLVIALSPAVLAAVGSALLTVFRREMLLPKGVHRGQVGAVVAASVALASGAFAHAKSCTAAMSLLIAVNAGLLVLDHVHVLDALDATSISAAHYFVGIFASVGVSLTGVFYALSSTASYQDLPIGGYMILSSVVSLHYLKSGKFWKAMFLLGTLLLAGWLVLSQYSVWLGPQLASTPALVEHGYFVVGMVGYFLFASWSLIFLFGLEEAFDRYKERADRWLASLLPSSLHRILGIRAKHGKKEKGMSQ